MNGLRHALAFLLPLKPRGPDELPPASAVHWFVPIGFGIGITYALVFGIAWRVYGEYFGLRLLPAVAILIADAAFFGRRPLAGACAVAQEVAGGPPAGQAPVAPAAILPLLAFLLKLALVLSLPRGQESMAADWRRHLAVLVPGPVFRPIILMPVWGRWAVLLTLCLGRPRAGQPQGLLRLMDAARLAVVFGWLVPCAALTATFCGIRGTLPVGLIISAITLAAAYLSGVLMSWRLDGQTTASVYATGLAGETAFLLAYLPFGSRIYGW